MEYRNNRQVRHHVRPHIPSHHQKANRPPIKASPTAPLRFRFVTGRNSRGVSSLIPPKTKEAIRADAIRCDAILPPATNRTNCLLVAASVAISLAIHSASHHHPLLALTPVSANSCCPRPKRAHRQRFLLSLSAVQFPAAVLSQSYGFVALRTASCCY